MLHINVSSSGVAFSANKRVIDYCKTMLAISLHSFVPFLKNKAALFSALCRPIALCMRIRRSEASRKLLKRPDAGFAVCISTITLVFAAIGVTAVAHEQEHADVTAITSFETLSRRARIVNDPADQVMAPSLGGQWSPVYDWPLVAVHANLLFNGKVLAWDATPDDSDDDPHTTENYTTRVTLWDPITNTHTATNNDTDTDLFCAGSAHLWDGRVVFAGGDGGRAGANGPLSNSNIYNPTSNTWHRTANMNAPRWYSSVAALSNGELLTFGGSYTPTPIAEVFQFDQTWRALPFDLPESMSDEFLSGDYQWMQQTPEGTVLSFGPENFLADIRTEGTGQIEQKSARDDIKLRDYGSYAMYDVGKILVAGGADATQSAIVIDTSTHQTSSAGNMNIGRRQHNLTILADGSVLVTGGNDDGTEFYSNDGGVFIPEVWNPQNNTWTTQNPMRADRQYHSVALLLPDGRVLSAGGGICGDCYAAGYEERNAEIFTPAYLFAEDSTPAIRPALFQVPHLANYDEAVTVSIANDTRIQKAHLIKLGSATHSENQDQRLVPLTFSQDQNQLNLVFPASRHAAPPGHYLLFVVNDAGVPSKGVTIKLGQPVVEAGQRVATVLENGAWDNYVTPPLSGSLTVQVSAAENVELYISEAAPASAQNKNRVLCSTNIEAGESQACVLDVETESTIFMTLTGQQRSEYTLEYRVSDIVLAQTDAVQTESSAPDTAQSDTFQATLPESLPGKNENNPLPNPQAVESPKDPYDVFAAEVEVVQIPPDSVQNLNVDDDVVVAETVNSKVRVGGGWLSAPFSVVLALFGLVRIRRQFGTQSGTIEPSQSTALLL